MHPGFYQRGLLALVLLTLYSHRVSADGVMRDGFGARAMSLGGASLVFADDPLPAMNVNPGALGLWKSSELELGMGMGILDAEFDNSISTGNDANSSPGVYPEAAYILPLNNQWTLGASISPVAAALTDWTFPDPPGALGGYGDQVHMASFLALRSALGLGYQVTPQLSIGASAGLIYNRNRLKAPYTFQSHPVLTGANVLVNLEADGFGVNGVISTNYAPADNVMLSLSYTTPSYFDAEGTLRGFGNGIGSFSYDAEVETELPQVISAGFSWQATDPLRLGLQIDWTDWNSAFDELPIHLTNGTNAVLNGLVSSTRIDDIIPLDWSDEIVLRLGMEYDWSDTLQLRAGYSYGGNPVPDGTLTPTGAAITEHLLSFGAGYRTSRYVMDFAYQWELPATERVETSRLATVEYDSTQTDVSIHWLSISVSWTDPFK